MNQQRVVQLRSEDDLLVVARVAGRGSRKCGRTRRPRQAVVGVRLFVVEEIETLEHVVDRQVRRRRLNTDALLLNLLPLKFTLHLFTFIKL